MTAATADLADGAHRGVPCVGCSLICDDLDISVAGAGIEAGGNACALARTFYRGMAQADTAPDAEAWIGAVAVPLEAALGRASRTLAAAKQPLLAGLDTDVAGVRAALRLAECCRAVIDPIDSDALFRNIRVMQTEGWLATTLGEARNRADLVLICGTTPITRFPRLLERLTAPGDTLFAVDGRRSVYLLGAPVDTPGPGPDYCVLTHLNVSRENLADFAGVLRGRLQGRQPALSAPEGVDDELLEQLLEKLRGSRYPVLVWAAAEFDSANGDLTVQRLVELAGALSKRTRCTTLALSRASSATTTTQVSGWYCGFPPRISFARGVPDYDPHRYSTARMLARGEADAMLWVGGMDPATPPPAAPIPRIVLGATRPPLEDHDVFIRIGVPGVDHAGQVFRADGVPLSLRKLRETGLPSAARVLDALREHGR